MKLSVPNITAEETTYAVESDLSFLQGEPTLQGSPPPTRVRVRVGVRVNGRVSFRVGVGVWGYGSRLWVRGVHRGMERAGWRLG